MIQTYTDPGHPTTIIHEVRGSVDRAQAEQGAKESLLAVQQAHAAHGTLRLLIDLRGMHFVDLPAHRAWSVGFARNPKLNEYVSHAAIVGTDTQQFRVEQEQMSNARVGFSKISRLLCSGWPAQPPHYKLGSLRSTAIEGNRANPLLPPAPA